MKQYHYEIFFELENKKMGGFDIDDSFKKLSENQLQEKMKSIKEKMEEKYKSKMTKLLIQQITQQYSACGCAGCSCKTIRSFI